jgi:hypothetical protein
LMVILPMGAERRNFPFSSEIVPVRGKEFKITIFAPGRGVPRSLSVTMPFTVCVGTWAFIAPAGRSTRMSKGQRTMDLSHLKLKFFCHL